LASSWCIVQMAGLWLRQPTATLANSLFATTVAATLPRSWSLICRGARECPSTSPTARRRPAA